MGYKEDTIQYYTDNTAEFVNGTINANMTNLYAHFECLLSTGDSILDLGCGSGRDSKHFSENGYNVLPVDGSKELCEVASRVSGVEAICLDFSEIDYSNKFDAVWACASLLHISEDELPKVIHRISKAIKPEGILYASFKYGIGSRIKDGRFFLDCDESKINELFNEGTGFSIEETFITEDVREGRSGEKWINVIARRVL